MAAVGARGGQALAILADVTDRPAVERAVAATVERFGRLDALVTSAGIQRYGNVVDTDEATWDEVFAVNVKGVFLAAQAALPHLRKSGHGVDRGHLLGPGPRRPDRCCGLCREQGSARCARPVHGRR